MYRHLRKSYTCVSLIAQWYALLLAGMPYCWLVCQQHTTLHPTAGLPLKLSRVGCGQSLDGSPDVTGSPVGGTILFNQKKYISKYLCAVIGDIALCWVLYFTWAIMQVPCLSMVTKDPMVLIVRVGG